MLVVDDHRVVAETLRMAIDLEEALVCVGIAGSAEEALDLMPGAGADVVLMDVRLPGMDGIEGTRRLKDRYPGLRVLILSAYTGVDVVARAAGAGASAVLAKEGTLADIVAAIRSTNDGALMVGSLALAPEAEGQGEVTVADPGLTKREYEVPGLLGEGLNPKSIARRLGISLETVRGHLKALMAKLDAHTQLEAVTIALRQGILPRGK